MALKVPFSPLRAAGQPVTPELLDRIQDRIRWTFGQLSQQIFFNYAPLPPGVPPGTPAAPSTATYWVSTLTPSLPNSVNMGALGTGVLQQTTTAGVATPVALALDEGAVLYGGSDELIAYDPQVLHFTHATSAVRISRFSSSADANASVVFRRAGGNSGTPTTVVPGYLSRIDVLAYDGTSYLAPLRMGTHIIPGQSVSTGSVPTEFFIKADPAGVSDSYATAMALRVRGEGIEVGGAGGTVGDTTTFHLWVNGSIRGTNDLQLFTTGSNDPALWWTADDGTGQAGLALGSVLAQGSGMPSIFAVRGSGILNALAILENTNTAGGQYSGVELRHGTLDNAQVIYEIGNTLRIRTQQPVPSSGGHIIIDPFAGAYVAVTSLATGGYVRADNTIGILSVTATIPVADVPGAVPNTRTLTTTAPLRIDGAAGPLDLSTNRTLSILDFVASGASHARGAVPTPGAVAGSTRFLREDASWAVPSGSGGTVTNVTGTLPITSTGGATPVIALNYDNVTITLNGSNEIRRAALTGDVTAPAGSNTTAFRSFAALSVLANATNAGAVPTDLAASSVGDVLQVVAGPVLDWAPAPIAPGTLLATFTFVVLHRTDNAAGLFVDPRWLASSEEDGEDESDAVDERGQVFTGLVDASSYSMTVKTFVGDARTVDSGDYKWNFELLKNGTTSVDTAAVDSGGSGPASDTVDDAEAFVPGDHVNVRLQGEQVSGTSTTGVLVAFVTVSLYA